MSDDPKLEELDKLISTGKQKGYVTYEELNDALPGDLISSYQLDDIMLMFGAMDIDVVDSAKAPRPLTEIEDSLNEREETVQAEPGDAIDLSPGPIGRTEHPVRMYLREMGRVSLLTREGEIALAKKTLPVRTRSPSLPLRGVRRRVGSRNSCVPRDTGALVTVPKAARRPSRTRAAAVRG